MSSHYNTEPPPTASAILHTTAGPLQISLFAKQTPLACQNFLQHCLDDYYVHTPFHRIVPGFVIQGGDPSGTGTGGTSIYEDDEFAIGADGEPVRFGDEVHSRLRFNRRGLVGMAKGEDGGYGSQFFITLANTERELNGQCTLFGRIEGDGIYNVVKIAEAECVEGTERPVYAVRVTKCEVLELGPFEGKLKKRERKAVQQEKEDTTAVKKKSKKKGKAGKALLSFGGGDEGEDGEATPVVKKPKFNTSLVVGGGDVSVESKSNGSASKERNPSPKRDSISRPAKRQRIPSPSPPPPTTAAAHAKPKPHDPTTQIPIRNDEEPSRSPTPDDSPPPPPPSSHQTALERTNAEIASLKASMRRTTTTTTAPTSQKKKSALEQMIPETSIRGRKRRHAGAGTETSASSGAGTDPAMSMFLAFQRKLDRADEEVAKGGNSSSKKNDNTSSNSTTTPHQKPTPETRNGSKNSNINNNNNESEEEEEEEEAHLCDLHFIANCQSCTAQETTASPSSSHHLLTDQKNDDEGPSWLTHSLTFEKDRLGKDLAWKKKNEEELVVIDPLVKGGEILGRERERRKGKKSGGSNRDWDRRGR